MINLHTVPSDETGVHRNLFMHSTELGFLTTPDRQQENERERERERKRGFYITISITGILEHIKWHNPVQLSTIYIVF
jgi:hypothetical protein